MATERLSMRHTHEILRQKWALGRSHREVARGLGVSNGTVGTTVLRARAAGLDWSQVQGLTDEALEARLYGRPDVVGQRQRPGPTAPPCMPSGRTDAGSTEQNRPVVDAQGLVTSEPNVLHVNISFHRSSAG